MKHVLIISQQAEQDIAQIGDSSDREITAITPTLLETIVTTIAHAKPDIVIIFDSTEEGNKNKLCQFLVSRYPKLKIAIVLRDSTMVTYQLLAESGFTAKGYITPSQYPQLAKAIDVICAGETWLPREIAAKLVQYSQQSRDNGLS